MRNYFICQRNSVSEAIKKHDINYVMSVIVPLRKPFFPNSFDKRNNWLMLNCEDEEDPNAYLAPTRALVINGLNWFNRVDGNILVHCEAGISRSTAMTFAALVQDCGLDKISDCAEELLRIRPQAAPNRLIVDYADEYLGAGGKMLDAAEAITQKWLIRNKFPTIDANGFRSTYSRKS